jgi:phospholipid N-methyltransferase
MIAAPSRSMAKFSTYSQPTIDAILKDAVAPHRKVPSGFKPSLNVMELGAGNGTFTFPFSRTLSGDSVYVANESNTSLRNDLNKHVSQSHQYNVHVTGGSPCVVGGVEHKQFNTGAFGSKLDLSETLDSKFDLVLSAQNFRKFPSTTAFF